MASPVFENEIFKLVAVPGKPDTLKIVWKVPEDQRQLKIVDDDRDIHPFFEGDQDD